jgi:predicted enzyme related to lactoylglutathione lyase
VKADYVFAGLVVSDRDRAAGWYARLLGRPADMLPNESEAAWQLTQTASLYLLADAKRAGLGIITVVVADLDACLAQLTARGIAVAPVEQVGQAGRKCVLADPDGNSVSLVQLHHPEPEAPDT